MICQKTLAFFGLKGNTPPKKHLIFGGGALSENARLRIIIFEIIYFAEVLSESAPRKENVN